jgi:hypothetical protein
VQRQAIYPWTDYAAQAADVLLDRIARSGGTRPSVTRARFATRVGNGLTGSFSFARGRRDRGLGHDDPRRAREAVPRRVYPPPVHR